MERSNKSEGLMRRAACVFAAAAIALLGGCGGGGGSPGRGGELGSPALVLSRPTAGSTVADVAFVDDSFVVEVSYQDESGMSAGTLSVTMKMDDGSAQNITSYFTAAGSKITSSNLNQYTSALFEVQNNDETRTITLNVSIQDIYANTGILTTTFTVSPGGDDGNPPAPPPPVAPPF